jgi:hypothetical protein
VYCDCGVNIMMYSSARVNIIVFTFIWCGVVLVYVYLGANAYLMWGYSVIDLNR